MGGTVWGGFEWMNGAVMFFVGIAIALALWTLLLVFLWKAPHWFWQACMRALELHRTDPAVFWIVLWSLGGMLILLLRLR